jgi:hypothetical protein
MLGVQSPRLPSQAVVSYTAASINLYSGTCRSYARSRSRSAVELQNLKTIDLENPTRPLRDSAGQGRLTPIRGAGTWQRLGAGESVHPSCPSVPTWKLYVSSTVLPRTTNTTPSRSAGGHHLWTHPCPQQPRHPRQHRQLHPHHVVFGRANPLRPISSPRYVPKWA